MMLFDPKRCSRTKQHLAGVSVTHPRPLSSEQEQKEGAQLPPVATGVRQTEPFWEGTGEEVPSAPSPQPL